MSLASSAALCILVKGKPVRWWYYVSAPLVRSSKETKASLTRISQGEADRFVRRAVADHLRGRGEQAEAKVLEKSDILAARDILDKYVEKVVLASSRVELHFLPILTKEGKLDVLDPVPMSTSDYSQIPSIGATLATWADSYATCARLAMPCSAKVNITQKADYV